MIKRLIHRLLTWEYSGLCLLVLATLVMHFSIITQPDKPIFDEEYYVADARHILQGEGSERIEHPPLGKLLITSGMFIFGDNPVGWRSLSVLFGAICTVLFYLICRRLALSREISFLATFLLALENLNFIQSGVAMLDVLSFTFMLLAFSLYLKRQYLTSGTAIGLSTLAKLSGALGLLVIILHWLLTNRPRVKRFVISLVLAPLTFLVLTPLLDLIIWRRFTNPLADIKTMIDITIHSTFIQSTTQAFSHPWDWIIRPESIVYSEKPHYIAMISPTIWVLIIPVVCYLIFRSFKGNRMAAFGLCWFIGTYLIWIPVSLISDRQSYLYYFYPCTGAICIGIAMALSELSNIKAVKYKKILNLVLPFYLVAHLGVFVFITPVSPYYAVPFCIALYVLARFYLKAYGSVRHDNRTSS